MRVWFNNKVVTSLWLGCDKVIYNEQGDEHALTLWLGHNLVQCSYNVVTRLYNVVTTLMQKQVDILISKNQVLQVLP